MSGHDRHVLRPARKHLRFEDLASFWQGGRHSVDDLLTAITANECREDDPCTPRCMLYDDRNGRLRVNVHPSRASQTGKKEAKQGEEDAKTKGKGRALALLSIQ